MTREEFDAIQAEYQCWSCKQVGTVIVVPHPSDATHPGGLRCSACDTFQRPIGWLQKDKNLDKRPPLKSGTLDAVWRRWGNACSHCGISADDLAFIGVMRTVQHAPPYREVGSDATLLPYCAWCQQRSESESKRIRSLIERLRRGHDVR